MLKESIAGLSKAWDVEKCFRAFFDGGKFEVSEDETVLVSHFQENVVTCNWPRSAGVSELFDSNDEARELISCFCIAPSGEYITIATQNRLLKLIRVSDISCMRTVKGHQMPTLCMTYDSTGTLVATGSADRTVKVWDMEKGFCTHSFRAHGDIVQTILFYTDSRDITILFSGGADSMVYKHDLNAEAGEAASKAYRGHMSLPTAFSVSNRGNLLASTGRDKVVNFYDIRTNTLIKTVAVFEELVGAAFLSQDHIAMWLPDQGLEDRDDSKDRRKSSRSPSANVSFARPEQRISSTDVLVVAGTLGVLRLYRVDIKDGDFSTFECKPIAAIPVNTSAENEEIMDAAELRAYKQHQLNSKKSDTKQGKNNYKHDAKSSTAAAESGSGISASASAATDAVLGLQYLPRSGRIVAATADHIFCVFDIVLGHPYLRASHQIIGSYGDILDIAYLNKQSTTSSVDNPSLQQEENAGASTAEVRGSTEAHSKLAIVTNSQQVRLFESSNACCEPLLGHTDIVLAVHASADGEWVVTSSKDRTCRVWSVSVRPYRCVAVGWGHTDPVGCVAMAQKAFSSSPTVPGSAKDDDDDGSHQPAAISALKQHSYIVSGAGDKILKKWALPIHDLKFLRDDYNNKEAYVFPRHAVLKLEAVFNVRAHEKDINTVAISPNDAMIASGSQDKTVKLWAASDLTLLATLSGHKRGIWRVCFSPVDRCLVSCSGDRTLRLWSAVDFSCLRTFEGHTGSVLTVQFVNKGMQLLSGSADGLIRLWTIRSGECETVLEAHDEKVWAIAVAPGSNTLLPENTNCDNPVGVFYSGGGDGKLQVWRDTTQAQEEARLTQAENEILLEQQMQNDLRAKRYDKALDAALDLNHPRRTLIILTTILEEEEEENTEESNGSQNRQSQQQDSSGSSDEAALALMPAAKMSGRFDRYVRGWTDTQIERVITFLLDWNTNARYSYLSALLLNSMVRELGIHRLMDIRAVSQSLAGILAYSERHFQRIGRLHQSTYLADYLGALMHILPQQSSDLGSSPLSVAAGKQGPSSSLSSQKRKMVAPDHIEDTGGSSVKKQRRSTGGGDVSMLNSFSKRKVPVIF